VSLQIIGSLLTGSDVRLGQPGGTPVVAAAFREGFCLQRTIGSAPRMISGWMGDNATAEGSGGYSYIAWGYWEGRVDAITSNIILQTPLAVLDNWATATGVFDTTPFNANQAGVICGVVLLGSTAGGQPKFGLYFKRGALDELYSAVLFTGTANTVYTIEWSAQQTAATNVDLKLYVNGVQQGGAWSVAITAGSPADGVIWRRHSTGWLTNVAPAKGVTVTISSGAALFVSNAGSGPVTRPTTWGATGPKSALRLPSGDAPGETQWTKSGGGAGSYTTWDDAAGAFDAADYNTGAGAGTKQGSTLPATSAPGDATFAGMAVGAYQNGGTGAGTLQFALDDGAAESVKTPYTGISAGAANQQTWADPPSGAWSVGEANSVHVACIDGVAAGSPSIAALWCVDLWYETAAPPPPAPDAPAQVAGGKAPVTRPLYDHILGLRAGDGASLVRRVRDLDRASERTRRALVEERR